MTPLPRFLLLLTGLLIIAGLSGCTPGVPRADLIVEGHVWTGDLDAPWAEAVAVQADRILAVGTAEAIDTYRGFGTRVLTGAMVLPGFIDNHTHFNRAGELLLGINLLDVSDEAGLKERVREARDRLPDDAWMVGGDWSAYEEWAQGSAGTDEETQNAPTFQPHRDMIDDLTPNMPVLLSRWDRSTYLANARALDLAGADCSWEGVACDDAGTMTGRLSPEAAERVLAVRPPVSFEQRLLEARVALQRLAENGVTSFHDITSDEQLRVFQAIKERGELTARVYARPTLDKWEHLAALGITHGFGDEWIRLGGLKGFVDGIMGNSSARFYEPYLTSGEVGSWRPMMQPPGNMLKLLVGADSSGLWPQVHAIGDQAIDSLLNLFEETMRINGPRDRRFRMIHTQVLHGPEVAQRMADLGIIAEVQPYHAIDDMRWMEERIGERSRWAYAFKTLNDAGVLLSFGSDWPGTNASWYPAKPLLGIYAAVQRQTMEGQPPEGWFPEERIDLETALRAYTVNNAYATGEEALKGMLKPGLLADIVVVSHDLTAIPGEQIRDTHILYTLVGGEVVYEHTTDEQLPIEE